MNISTLAQSFLLFSSTSSSTCYKAATLLALPLNDKRSQRKGHHRQALARWLAGTFPIMLIRHCGKKALCFCPYRSGVYWPMRK